ncbi:MAG: hypothetical protein IJS01_09035 [Lentisphaeria bacterium]|nr:hypothetical protein [Oscillospiraceae bacterium]MBQ7207927.1 hypothetical protein [Lentisphaeria bacterium]
MYGALLGDMIGAPYEFDMGNKTKEFPLFCSESHYTDDSVMTIAVAEALLDSQFQDDETIKAGLVDSMRKWGKKYPDAGYGGSEALQEFDDHGDTVMFACGEPFYGTPGKGKNEVRMAYVIKREDLERAMDILAVAIERYRREVMGL